MIRQSRVLLVLIIVVLALVVLATFAGAQPAPRVLVGVPAYFQGQDVANLPTTEGIRSTLDFTAAYWKTATYGRLVNTVGGVAPPYPVPRPPRTTGGCFNDWFPDAENAALRAIGGSFGQNTNFFIAANEPVCSFRSDAPLNGNWALISLVSPYVVAHELGHDFGLNHAGSLTNCAVYFVPSTCTSHDYAAPYSPMGAGTGHPSPIDLMRLGGILTPQIDTAGGTYTLRPIESFPDALLIQLDGIAPYVVDHREPIGLDAPGRTASALSVWSMDTFFGQGNAWVWTITTVGAAYEDRVHGVNITWNGGNSVTVYRFTPEPVATPTPGIPDPTRVPLTPATPAPHDCLHPSSIYDLPCTPTRTPTVTPTRAPATSTPVPEPSSTPTVTSTVAPPETSPVPAATSPPTPTPRVLPKPTPIPSKPKGGCGGTFGGIFGLAFTAGGLGEWGRRLRRSARAPR